MPVDVGAKGCLMRASRLRNRRLQVRLDPVLQDAFESAIACHLENVRVRATRLAAEPGRVRVDFEAANAKILVLGQCRGINYYT
jgi:hypothetical protein